MRTLRRLFLLVFAGLGVLALAFVVGMRTKSPLVQDRVRRFARDVGNPRALKTAGTDGDWASVVHHIGRTSANEYATPVTAFPTGDGFVITLPYGPGTDWVRNVIAAGGTTVTTNGERHTLTRPEVVSTGSIGEHLPRSEQLTTRLFKVDECLRLYL